ncbi:MAG: 16S rRNA (cytosine(1402)-N(4))-methyltransferase, partial [Clostridia bacterium]|nr:16S rRNA (cytosine(1402)-N(4))-methyltransferase [Clostridia bacterium]
PARRTGGNPCKKTFQAIRIEVNGELEELDRAVQSIARKLKKGGRMCVITFHSLEDRIVKNVFREMELDCICDKSVSPICTCNKVKEGVVITRKPIEASEDELASNRRAQSAKLRIFERI